MLFLVIFVVVPFVVFCHQEEANGGDYEDEEGDYSSIKFQDLSVLTTLGVGGFGRVELVRLTSDATKTFALKQLKKSHIVQTKQEQHIGWLKRF